MRLVVLSGPSAVGKDKIVGAALELWGSVSITPLTTRSPRPTETDGAEYRFVSVAAFQRLILSDSLLVWDYLFDNYYGYGLDLAAAPAAQSSNLVVVHCLARMALRLRAMIPDTVLVYLGSSDFALLDQRLAQRSISREEFQLRVKHRDEEATHAPMFDLIIEDAAEMKSSDALAMIATVL